MNDLVSEKKRNDDLIVNPTPRCACILVLDTSASMNKSVDGDSPINELNAGVAKFLEEVKTDELAQYSVELGVVTAGPNVVTQQPITPAHLIESVNPFSAGGNTPLGEAVEVALNMLDNRKAEYKRTGTPHYQPWLVIISDGKPTDSWQKSASRASVMANNKKLVVMPIGVSGADLSILSQFSNRPAKAIAGLKFSEFFAWLSASMARVSASASTSSQVNLPSTGSWDTI
ncbi:hypothetical protein FACS1894141_1710 [Spirochaetia bacterium]|nr:hypothetical protein FACS1894141_1710 [Spirochaetia bacterium]